MKRKLPRQAAVVIKAAVTCHRRAEGAEEPC